MHDPTLTSLPDWGLAAMLVAGGILLGLVVERALLRWLVRLARRTPFVADDVVVPAFRGLPFFWGVAAGLYAAAHTTALPVPVADLLGNTLLVAVLITLTVLGARIAAGFVRIYTHRPGSVLPATSLVPNLTQVFVWSVGALVVLSSLGISIAPVLTALGVGGLAVALALQDTLANVFAGVYLLASRQVRVGDYVRLESGEEGYVADLAWRSTSLRTRRETLVVVPNVKLASSLVTNLTLPTAPLRVEVPLGAAYGQDLDRVEAVALAVAGEVAAEVWNEAPPFAPDVFFHTFGEFSVNYTVRLPAPDAEGLHRVRHVFVKRLAARLVAEGLPMPFPIKELEMEVGSAGATLRRSDAQAPGAKES